MNIIEPKDIFNAYGIGRKNIKRVYLFFHKKLFNKVNKNFEFKKENFTRGELYIEKNNNFAVVTSFGTGFSSALMLAEELAEFGFEEVIAVGISGYLDVDARKKVGDVFLIDKIFSQVDLSNVYAYTDEYIQTSKKLNKTLNIDNIANTISVITLYRESSELVRNSLKKGISIIEMESFPLALVFNDKEIEFSQIVSISDILSQDKWSFKKENLDIALDNLNDIMIKIENQWQR
jgi:purine-nucleoside phosphorylase